MKDFGSKTIHYCWFGKQELPQIAKKCIQSWKKYFPDYEIKEWNETNFNLDCCAYVREAYQAGKWAFVSDYARFWILYHYGGIYFDVDVEVIRDFNDIIGDGAFMGCEAADEGTVAPGLGLGVNPGLGLGVNPGLGLYKEMLDYYQSLHFIRPDGKYNTKTIVEYTTQKLKEYGFQGKGEVEHIAGVTIYPPEYFCPINYVTGEMIITEHTYSIHHYTASWTGRLDKFIMEQRWMLYKKGYIRKFVGNILLVPLRVVNRIRKEGIQGVTTKLWEMWNYRKRRR